MPEIDIYAEGFTLGHNAYSAIIKFTRMSLGQSSAVEEMATVRMSYQQLKAMALLMARHVRIIEEQLGTEIPVQQQFLSNIQIAHEDWHKFGK